MAWRALRDVGTGARVVLAALLVAASSGARGDKPLGGGWPEFRGPRGDGTSLAGDLPLHWSETENVAWKTAIHGQGWSTPVIRDDWIWLTTATEDGRDLFAVCVDRASGRIRHDLPVFHVRDPEPLGNPVNSYASPSPVIEAGRVFVHFGTYGTACLDPSRGTVLWKRTDLHCRHYRGPGSSPVLFRDLLILTLDGYDVQYLAALDKRTGKTVWKTNRSYDFGDLDGDLRKAYSTPLVVKVGNAFQLISCSAKAGYAYDPLTGREIWKVRYRGFSNAARPIQGAGLVFLNTGFSKADLWAVRPTGHGDVTGTHVVWKVTRGVSLKPSPVFVAGRIFMVSDSGIATCLDARTGKLVWKSRIGGKYSASPLYGAGRVYFFSEEGVTTVIRPADRLDVRATNRLAGGFMASPSAAGKMLYLRTRTHLYAIGSRDR